MLQMGKKEYKLNHFCIFGWFKTVCWEWRKEIYACENCACFSTDIGIEIGIKKCGILKMKRGKIVKSEEIKLPDDEVMNQLVQEGYTFLDITELGKIKET